jgi:ferredoxin-NADP reductase
MTIHLRFLHCQDESEDTASFFFQPESPLEYQAGQYLHLVLPHPEPDERGISRSFSIASSPRERVIRIATRLSTPASTYKQALAGLRPGAVLDAQGPFGDFVYADGEMTSVFIVGGIGITPVRAILDDLATRTPHNRATLLYSNTTPDIPFHTNLDSLASDWPDLHVVYTVSRPDTNWQGRTGRVDPSFIKEHVSDLATARFYVSGPTPMVDDMCTILAEMGVDGSRIKQDGFPGYESSR